MLMTAFTFPAKYKKRQKIDSVHPDVMNILKNLSNVISKEGLSEFDAPSSIDTPKETTVKKVRKPKQKTTITVSSEELFV